MAKARKPSIDTPPTALESLRDERNDRNRIAMRAYELYLARGGADGGDFDDWLAAEREFVGSNGGARGEDIGE